MSEDDKIFLYIVLLTVAAVIYFSFFARSTSATPTGAGAAISAAAGRIVSNVAGAVQGLADTINNAVPDATGIDTNDMSPADMANMGA
jgi:hypothetical protein